MVDAMDEDSMWDGFAGAVVRLAFPDGTRLLEPRSGGDVGEFPFGAPVHIVTAYNPAGIEIDEQANIDRHRRLGDAVAGFSTVATVGSAPDGSMPEPGFALQEVELSEALDLAREFGQRAIYRWTPDELAVIGVDELRHRRLGWSLTELR